MPDLIAFLDRCAALRDMPREDRIRAGLAELRRIAPMLPGWLATKDARVAGVETTQSSRTENDNRNNS